jgi:uncharacterized protein YdaU (DUF1376 family)
VNYYNFHIGDYLRDTVHLTVLEDGCYRRMLDLYYASEKPLPLNIDGLYRLVRAKTDDERKAIDTVLEEFFQRRKDGWHNKRADEEIERAKEDGDDRAARKEHEAERQRRHRERRKSLFAQLRELGEIPKWDTTTDKLVTRLVALQSRTCHGDRDGNSNAPATANPIANNQEPITNNQEPKKDSARKKRAVSLPTDFAISERVKTWAESKGFQSLDAHLEHFVGWARASGRAYADWDQAFMNAVREDWAKVRANGSTPDYSAVIAGLKD